MVDVARARKLAGRIQKIVAETLPTLADKRVRGVVITDARVTGDLRDATVYYTIIGDDAAGEHAAQALERAKGLLRTAVGAGTGVRFTPTLTFVRDTISEHARSIDLLLEQAREADEAVQAIASQSRPAGDPDPYDR